MAPIRYSSPSENENSNNDFSSSLHNTIFQRTHWTNEPDHVNWETFHRLQNQLQRLEMEILIMEIEVITRSTTPDQTRHWRRLKRLHAGTQAMMNILLTDSNYCPHCNQESDQDFSENNEQ